MAFQLNLSADHLNNCITADCIDRKNYLPACTIIQLFIKSVTQMIQNRYKRKF